MLNTPDPPPPSSSMISVVPPCAPHRYLLNLCRMLDAAPRVVAASICLLNDSLLHTRLCLRRQPLPLAAAALQVAASALGEAPAAGEGGGGGGWVVAAGLDGGLVDQLADALVAMMAAQASRATGGKGG